MESSSNETSDCLTSIDGHLCYNQTLIYMEKPHDMLNPWAINPAFIPIVVTHGVTFLIGIVGNTVVIITWVRGGKIHSPTGTFLVSLAIADLLLLFLYVPLETIGYFVITWDIDGSICKLSAYVEMLSGTASVLNLVAVSIERFLVIVYPIKARRWCTVSTSRKGLLIVWSLAILLAGPIPLDKSVYPITYYNNFTSLTAYYCWDSNDEWALFIAIYQLLVIFAVPGLLMIVCYAFVIQELWASTKMVTTLTAPTHLSFGSSSAVSVDQDGRSYVVRWFCKHQPNNCSSIKSSDKTTSNVSFQKTVTDIREGRKQVYLQVIKLLLFIVVIFHLCWGPRLIMNVVIKLGLQGYNQYTYSLRVACYLLSFIHSALNPFVYGFMSSNFRRMIHSCHQSNHIPSTSMPDMNLTPSYINMSQYNHSNQSKPDCETNTSLGNNLNFSSINESAKRSASNISINNY